MKMRFATAFFGLCALGLGAAPGHAEDADSPAARQSRWRELEKTLFHGRTAASSQGVVALAAPDRAEDAAIVPMQVTLAPPDKVKALWLIIDDNPMPVVAHIVFGPAADPHVMKFRVRVNSYTNVQAVAETRDGGLVADVKFVKASGGCSAPMGEGDIRLSFAGPASRSRRS